MPGVKLTYEDLVRLPDDGLRHELIDGEHFVTPQPKPRHLRVVRNISTAIETYAHARDLGWVLEEPGVTLGRFNTVVPDIAFLTAEQVRHMDMDADLDFAPALVIEVSSPSTAEYDQTKKREFYGAVGVREYWFVDVPASAVWIYRQKPSASAFADSRPPFADPVVLRRPSDVLSTPCIPGLELRLADVFDLRRPAASD